MSAFSGRAADLPDASVVADNAFAYIKHWPTPYGSSWHGTDGSDYSNREIDAVLDEGAELLRKGAGQ